MRKANFKLIFKASASILFLLHSTGCNSLTQGKGNTTAVGTTIAPPNSSSVVVQNSGSGQYGTNGYGSSNVNTPVGIQNPTLSLGNSISFFKFGTLYYIKLSNT
jgi:hypothetical protein